MVKTLDAQTPKRSEKRKMTASGIVREGLEVGQKL